MPWIKLLTSRYGSTRGGSSTRMMLRMSISGLPNYLWSDAHCKKGQCNGNWDPHLENFVSRPTTVCFQIIRNLETMHD